MPKKSVPRSDNPWDEEKEDQKKTWVGKIKFSNLAEPTIFGAITTAFFYILISGYYDSYFKRLSIPFYSLDLPFTFYLYSAHWILYFIYYILLFFMLSDGLKRGFEAYSKASKYDKVAIMITQIILIMAGLFVLSPFIDCGWNLSIIIFSVLIPIIFILFLKDKHTKGKIDQEFVILAIFLLLVVSTTIPPNLGRSAAENLIRGEEGSFEAKLDLKNGNPDLLSRTLILVIHSNNKYYLVEKNESIPKEVKLYIIPDDQIKMATIEAVGGESRSVYEIYKNWILSNLP